MLRGKGEKDGRVASWLDLVGHAGEAGPIMRSAAGSIVIKLEIPCVLLHGKK